ncbi:MAG TPA: hypothetical protein VK590_13290 [Saprospiraceae bacterium]|nr:hypothetical protein [Saprospiraceae bacterium]
MRSKNNNLTLFYISILLLVFFTGCTTGEQEKLPNVANIKLETNIYRFDQELFTADTNHFENAFQGLGIKYPEFSQVYFDNVLGLKDPKIAMGGAIPYVRGFICSPQIRRLYDTCQIVFKDFQPIYDQFESAFKYMKYYFPQKTPPTITTYISEYSYAIFVYGKGDLGVGLDFFLGDTYPYAKMNYENPNFSNYLTRTYNKDHLVSKSMSAIIDDWIGPSPDRARLLDYMIHNGKRLYILDKLMPLAQDSVKLEYSAKQVKFIKENEANIWAYFTTENLLYSEDYQKIRKYIEPSPNAPGMPAEVPGRIANWIGLQIVRAYMKSNPRMSLDDLIKLTDPQTIMNQSKYKPKKK